MANEKPNPAVLDYARPVLNRDAIRFFVHMRWWRAIAVWALLLTIGAFQSGENLVIAIAATALVAAIAMTLIYMTYVAAQEVSGGYALRHLALGLLLLPFFYIGILAIPLMVESDVKKWRDVEEAEVKEREKVES